MGTLAGVAITAYTAALRISVPLNGGGVEEPRAMDHGGRDAVLGDLVDDVWEQVEAIAVRRHDSHAPILVVLHVPRNSSSRRCRNPEDVTTEIVAMGCSTYLPGVIVFAFSFRWLRTRAMMPTEARM